MSALLSSHVRRTATAVGLDAGPAISLLLLGYFAVVVLFSWSTLVSLHVRWLDFGYSHGYLVLALVAGLAVRALNREPVQDSAASLTGFSVLLLSMLGIVTAYAASVSLAAQLLLPVSWLGAVWAVAGWRSARRFLLPFGFFYFAVPIWDLLNTPLQDLTVIVVSALVRLVDIPAFIEGNLIHIPSGTFEVAGGCSGLHYFVVGLALAALQGILHHDRWGPRCALVLAALGLSLCANWLRVFTVIVAGHLTEMQHFLVVTDHYYFGWALFLVFFIPVVLLDRRLQSVPDQAPMQGNAPMSSWPTARVMVLSVAIATMGAGSWMQRGFTASAGTALPIVEVFLPDVPGWSRVEEWQGDSRPSLVGVSGEAAHEYANDVGEVSVYVGQYVEQRQGREAIFYANRPEGNGEIVAEGRVSVLSMSGAVLPFTELQVVESDTSRRLVWRGIRVAGRNAASNARAKALQAAGVFGGRRDAQVLVLSAGCPSTCEGAKELLSQYAVVAAEAVYESAARAIATN